LDINKKRDPKVRGGSWKDESGDTRDGWRIMKLKDRF
jgi:hypothetical protein